MGSRVRFPVLPWGFFLEGEDHHGDHGLGSLVEFRFKVPPGTSSSYISPSTSSGQRNRASRASQPQKSVTLRPQPGRGDHEAIKGHVVAMKKIVMWDPIENTLRTYFGSQFMTYPLFMFLKKGLMMD
jgi:hypothetical protein